MTSIRNLLFGVVSTAGIGLLGSNGAQALLITGGDQIEGIGTTCLEVGGVASTATSAPVDAWSCNAGLNQQWIITDGHIQKINNGTMTCLEVAGESKAAGAQVKIGNCSSDPSQVWELTQKGQLLNVASGHCLSWGNGLGGNGGKMYIEVCNNTYQQQFWLR